MDETKYTCEFCNNIFSSIKSLSNHQKITKYCLTLQGKNSNNHKCEGCLNFFSTNAVLNNHKERCIDYIKHEVSRSFLEEIHEKEKIINEKESYINELKDTLKEVITLFKQNNPNIKCNQLALIERKFKSQRVQYDGSNFIYIITSPSLFQNRTYIIGKTINLTNRLNIGKSEEYNVIFYQTLPSVDLMDTVEKAVYSKLSEYRLDHNRDHFILPENKSIELFKDIINECINFFKK